MSDHDLEDRAAGFWAETALADAYPRAIEQAIALKLPVTVVKLPVVTVQTVGHWLRRHSHAGEAPAYTRDLMGCLFAHGGHGFIFLCGADEPEEQRFTVAHDVAHFLVDYWWPRLRVIRELGPAAADVLDGRRPADHGERAAAILGGVRLGPHWHLLPRAGSSPDDDPRVAPAEDRADELGLELVAPRGRVAHVLQGLPTRTSADERAACTVLGSYFGVPGYVFRAVVAASRPTRAASFLDDVRRGLRR